MATLQAPFPASLGVDYPDHPLNRLTSFFRPLTLIPIAVVLASVTGPAIRAGSANVVAGAGGVLFLATVFMLLFRQKYPRWWFDWNLALTKFSARVCAYAALLRDEYPSTHSEQAVRIEIPYPDASRQLNR